MTCKYCNGTGIWLSPMMGGKYPCEECSSEQNIDSDIQYDKGSGEWDVFEHGRKDWKVNGEWHRVGAPALVWASGRKEWYKNGNCHRENGPAVECDGCTAWYWHGKKHKIDGPAVEYANGSKEWWIDGTRMSVEEFKLHPDSITF